MSGLIPTTTQQSHAGRHVCPHECLQPSRKLGSILTHGKASPGQLTYPPGHRRQMGLRVISTSMLGPQDDDVCTRPQPPGCR